MILQSVVKKNVLIGVSRPVAWGEGVRGGATHPSKSGKRSTLGYKVCQKWGFCRRVKGLRGVRFKKSTF